MLIAFKLKLALACAAGLAGPLAVAPFVMENDAADASLRDRQAVVELHLGEVSYRVNGDFTRAGKQAAAPLVQVRLPPARDHAAPGELIGLSALRRRRRLPRARPRRGRRR